jgi:hypothetical protein
MTPSENREPVEVVYIAGWGRSGSTLLGNVLNEIEGFFFTGELRYVWEHGLLHDRSCGCGAPIQSCPVWERVFEQALGDLGPGQVQRMADLRDAVTQPRRIAADQWLGLTSRPVDARPYLDVVERLYRTIAQVTNSRYIVDSSKTPGELHLIPRMSGIELCVLHLVRDARGCAYSWKKSVERQDTDAQMMEQRSVAAGTLRWGLWNTLIETLGRGARCYHRLHYETFAEAPERSLRALVNELGEPQAKLPFLTGSSVSMGRNHTIWGNPKRVEGGPVEIALDDEWKREQPAADRMLASLVGFPWLLRYGYPIRAR